ncbi:MAG TPA: ABC transporter ATP-binding protein [Solirubrobacteraceae bacterium]|nr:ABC transporter ATP-binding protein [Solirubrobacteraceae bacterium]
MRLSIQSLQAWYGRTLKGTSGGAHAGSQALFGVDLHVGEGETVALIGRNGAGKSTTLQCAMGVHRQRTGSIEVGGRETIGLSSHRIARLGMALVPQGRRIFPELTVEENLRAGIGSQARQEPGVGWSMERLFDVFPLLAGVRSSKGGWLSGGEQQVLAIARALISNPLLLLLDEPTEGLAPRVVETLSEQLCQIKQAGLTILLAEQHLGLVRELASRAYVIDRGVVRAEGEPSALLADEQIRHAYLSL